MKRKAQIVTKTPTLYESCRIKRGRRCASGAWRGSAPTKKRTRTSDSSRSPSYVLGLKTLRRAPQLSPLRLPIFRETKSTFHSNCTAKLTSRSASSKLATPNWPSLLFPHVYTLSHIHLRPRTPSDFLLLRLAPLLCLAARLSPVLAPACLTDPSPNLPLQYSVVKIQSSVMSVLYQRYNSVSYTCSVIMCYGTT